jgi:DMSO reductase anchor subunit
MSHAKGPPPEDLTRAKDAQRPQPEGRDITPAVGHRGSPSVWRHAVEDGVVALARPNWGDAKWSYLYDKATRYRAGGEAGTNGTVAEAARAARGGDEVPVAVSGPVINAAVWTWEVPLYFWFGGIATGSSFIALACDAAGDHRSARVARMVALGAIGPGSPLLVLDLGRPMRFLNMLRIFKPRSPMSMGAWCLSAFSGVMGTAVLADLLGREKIARALGAQGAVLGTYLGSYTGVLLSATAVPVWNRSRTLLPPIFICTGAATGAAANRLVLSALGVPAGHPTRRALGAIETLAMTTELGLSHLNEKRLGDLGHALEEGRPGRLFRFAKSSVMGGLALRGLGSRLGTAPGHVSSALFLAAGLAFRFAWVGAGRTSATDHEAVARTARRRRV